MTRRLLPLRLAERPRIYPTEFYGHDDAAEGHDCMVARWNVDVLTRRMAARPRLKGYGNLGLSVRIGYVVQLEEREVTRGEWLDRVAANIRGAGLHVDDYLTDSPF